VVLRVVGVVTLALAMMFRNADGSLTLGRGWGAADRHAIWCAWGLVALVRPSVLQNYFSVEVMRATLHATGNLSGARIASRRSKATEVNVVRASYGTNDDVSLFATSQYPSAAQQLLLAPWTKTRLLATKRAAGPSTMLATGVNDVLRQEIG
jgi:hypothetical protein